MVSTSAVILWVPWDRLSWLSWVRRLDMNLRLVIAELAAVVVAMVPGGGHPAGKPAPCECSHLATKHSRYGICLEPACRCSLFVQGREGFVRCPWMLGPGHTSKCPACRGTGWIEELLP